MNYKDTLVRAALCSLMLASCSSLLTDNMMEAESEDLNLVSTKKEAEGSNSRYEFKDYVSAAEFVKEVVGSKLNELIITATNSWGYANLEFSRNLMPEEASLLKNFHDEISTRNFETKPSEETTEKCFPCEAENEVRAFSLEEVEKQLKTLELSWSCLPGEQLKIFRSYDLNGVDSAMKFSGGITRAAEELGHHPKLIFYGASNNIEAELWTFSVGGVTDFDFKLAERLDEVYSSLPQ